MKIAIWGSCNYGNYGDDIMVLMFARFIKEHGATPVTYRLDSRLAKIYDVKTVSTLEELVKEAKFTLIAGGSWLEKKQFKEENFGFEKDFIDLLSTLEKYNCPLYSFSIGGDGHEDPSILTKSRLSLFSSDVYKGGSVRLPEDVKLLKTLGKEVKLFPDIVLSLPKFWAPKTDTKSEKGLKIGLQLSSNGIKIFKTIDLISWVYPNQYYSINSHLPNYGLDYELKFPELTSKKQNFQYEDPQTFIDFISSLDILISSKLHTTVTAISYGVPILLLGGLNKTKNFLKSIHAENSITEAKTINKYLLMNTPIKESNKNFDWDLIQRQQMESYQHFELLRSIISAYA